MKLEKPYKARPNRLTKSQYRPNKLLGNLRFMLQRVAKLFNNCKLRESNNLLCKGSKQANVGPQVAEAKIIQ